MRFVAGHDDAGRPLPLDDPLAEEIRKALAGSDRSADAAVTALLQLDQVFSPELAEDTVVRELIVDWLDSLTRHGVAKTVAGAGS
jgi:fructuronate reductase